MKIFYINLDKDIDRRNFMEAQFSKIGLSFERVPGVYCPELSEKEIENYYSRKLALRKQSRELNIAEIGCALSHIKIYKKIVEQKLPFALILEDDVIIPPDFKELIINLQLLVNQELPEVHLLSPAQGDFNQASRIRSSGQYKAVPFKYGFYASSYIVTQTAAQSLLKEHTPLGMVIDNWKRMNDFKLADFYILSPSLIEQDQLTFGSSTTANYKTSNNISKIISYKIRRLRCIILDFVQAAWHRKFHLYNDVLKRKL